MPKRFPELDHKPRDVSAVWNARGYCAEIANRPPRPGEDPEGEEAYQRAFSEAAKQRPPRVPNPTHYPNSPSAREYLRKREVETMPTKPKTQKAMTTPNPHYEPPALDMWRIQRETIAGAGAKPNAMPPGSTGSHASIMTSKHDHGVSPPPAIMTNGTGGGEVYFKKEPGSHNGSFSMSSGKGTPMLEAARFGSPISFTAGVPMVMEPKIDAPLGPTNRLR